MVLFYIGKHTVLYEIALSSAFQIFVEGRPETHNNLIWNQSKESAAVVAAPDYN